jgi:hypothetical protein
MTRPPRVMPVFGRRIDPVSCVRDRHSLSLSFFLLSLPLFLLI